MRESNGRRGRAVIAALVVALAATTACDRRAPAVDDGAEMNEVARRYVELVLAVGVHDADYVDAYYGPPEWREAAEAAARPLESIRDELAEVAASLESIPVPVEAPEALRHRYLSTQLGAVAARVEMLLGATFTFDEESRALYDAVAPHRTEAEFQAVLDELDGLLPGEGTLVERYARFREAFVIPPERLDTVFRAAIDACRVRTAEWLALPDGERFEIGYVTDKPWSGYNWYRGEYASLIQVNTDLSITIVRAVDLACHEGYPGHHLYNALLERELMRGRGWVEFGVYPLFSPQSLIAEGTANYGIEMAFPGGERIAYEREALFPLAGIDPSRADEYYRVEALVARLGYAGNEAARAYLDGEIDAEAAVEYLMRYAMMPRPRAEQRVRFIERYRSYVINYNLGLDLVRDWVERTAGDDEARRWEVFGSLLASPRLPSGLE